LAFDDWRVHLISPNRKVLATLSSLTGVELPGAGVLEQCCPLSQMKLPAVGAGGQREICILDLSVDEHNGLDAIHAVRSANPEIIIVAAVTNEQPSLILQALRQGANDFLTSPFTADQLHSVVQKLAQQEPQLAQARGRVVAIVPAKGACGASTIAFNLAVQLRKATQQRILLADLDPITGTQSFQMELKASYSFLDALQHIDTLDADLWKGLIQTYQGFDVLLPPDNPLAGTQDSRNARPIIDFARKLYQCVLVDIGDAYDEWALSIIRLADEVLLVATNELPALQAAQRLLGYYSSEGISRHKIRLVLNRHSKEVGLSKDMVEMALSTDVFHVLSSDYASVQTALLEGKPVSSNSSFGKQLGELADRIAGAGALKPAAVEESSKKSGMLSGLFSLFSRS
jgi:pilus assembly protein CpaE